MSSDSGGHVIGKRKHPYRVDWTRALEQGMASSKDLKTQTALAKKSGVAQSTIGRILRREVSPQSVNLERIANALGMPLSKLAQMGEEGEPREPDAKEAQP
jgi:ribosome-binding protein aMBF1 (putative translation factor)